MEFANVWVDLETKISSEVIQTPKTPILHVFSDVGIRF